MQKPSRLRRLFDVLAFRLIPLLLIVGILWTGYQVAQGLSQRVGEQNQAANRQPLYIATATALAQQQATPAVNLDHDKVVLAAYHPHDLAVQFETNTPSAPIATALPPTMPEPTMPEMTSRPLPTLYVYTAPEVESAGGTAVPTAVPWLDRHGDDLMNIVLLGNDGELTNDGFIRTDTMIVLSINRTAGTVSMLSLPRDLYVYIPGWTMQRLNLAYIHGEAVGWTDGGFGLLRQTLLYNFGLNVHYYAMVNLTDFKAIVDTVGGVDLAVDCAIEDLPLQQAEVPQGAYKADDDGHYVLPVGYYSMNGAEALWYARSRESSTDFDRGRRQQQVLRAVWRKAKETGILNNVIQLWNEGSQYMQTNMMLEDVLGLVPLALTIDPTRIEMFTFVRTYHTTPWQPPDGSFVQLPNYEPIRQTLEDFYTPPTANQLVIDTSSISVRNGTANANWDRVAADRLAWDGFNAVALGAVDDTTYPNTILIDHTGRSKGSSVGDIENALNIAPENVQLDPDPNRSYDYEVILGSNYTSCNVQGVLPVDPNPANAG